MKRAAILLTLVVFLISSCTIIAPGQIKNKKAPGQVQKETGYNPASGKHK
jgi:hypothetical protein